MVEAQVSPTEEIPEVKQDMGGIISDWCQKDKWLKIIEHIINTKYYYYYYIQMNWSNIQYFALKDVN